MKTRLHDGVRESAPTQNISIFDRNGTLLGEYNRGASLTLSLKQCGNLGVVENTLIASEDREFYDHPGFSVSGIIRAFWRNLISLEIKQGGGTITQQLARNTFTEKKKYSLNRKIYETIVALYIERQLTKKEIICLYLNKAYFGQNSYGIEEASRFYFNKSPSKLEYTEAALLIGILPAPSVYNPVRSISTALKRQKYVMELLSKSELVPEKQINKKILEFKSIYQIKENDLENPFGKLAKFGTNKYFKISRSPELNEYVIKYLSENFESLEDSKENIQVYTTIDIVKQSIIKNILNKDIDSLRWSFRNQSKLSYEEARSFSTGIQGVFVTMEPRTGEILAIAGGSSISDSLQSMNRAFYMKRQVGSAMKGFLYSVAIEEGVVDQNSELEDSPTDINGYKPRNWYGKYLGRISLSEALQKSVNTVAVKVLRDLGISRYIRYLQDGLSLSGSEASRFPRNLTLALGSADFSPIEVVTLYSSIVNGGTVVDPSIIRKIKVGQETVFENEQFSFGSKRLFKESTCGSVLNLLKSVFEPGGTAAWVGDRKRGKSGYLDFEIAGKSGTVESESASYESLGLKGARDVWFVGLTPVEVSAVWFGQDQGVPIPGSGSSVAASTWVSYANVAIHPKNDAKHFLNTSSSDLDSEWRDVPENSSIQENGSSPENFDPDPGKPQEKDEKQEQEEKFYVTPDEKPKG
ncbi:transglycosylase domain-containing protein [Leptospira sarikeiensis]|nr:transglycosylase domain-containing protein [Leptospira sarikeiensis]